MNNKEPWFNNVKIYPNTQDFTRPAQMTERFDILQPDIPTVMAS